MYSDHYFLMLVGIFEWQHLQKFLFETQDSFIRVAFAFLFANLFKVASLLFGETPVT